LVDSTIGWPGRVVIRRSSERGRTGVPLVEVGENLAAGPQELVTVCVRPLFYFPKEKKEGKVT